MNECHVIAVIPIRIEGHQITATNISDNGEYGDFVLNENVSKGQIRKYMGRNMWSGIDPNQNQKPLTTISPNCKWKLVEAGIPYTFIAGSYVSVQQWVAGSYSVGDVVVDLGHMFECSVATTDRPPFLTPDELKVQQDQPWLYHSPSNAYACFDYREGTKTTNDNIITYTVEPDNFTRLSFRGVDSNSIRIKVTDKDNPSDPAFFDETVAMTVGSNGWWEYFNKPKTELKNIDFDIGHVWIKNKKVEITIDNTGSKAGFGAWIWGFEVTLGVATGLSLDGKSFSEVVKNKFGITAISEEGDSGVLSIPMRANPDEVDEINERMKRAQGSPVLIIVKEGLRMATMYGLSLQYKIHLKHMGRAAVTYRIEEFN